MYNVDEPIFPLLDITLGQYLVILCELRISLKLGDTSLYIMAKTHAALTQSRVLMTLVRLEQTTFIRQVDVIVNRVMAPIPTLVIDACAKGCSYFVDNPENREIQKVCDKCGSPRYMKIGNTISPKEKVYYFSVYDRLYRLLSGDFGKFIDYPDYRLKPNDDTYEDILDSECYRDIKAMVYREKPNSTLIGLVACIDKAILFDKSVKGIEPLTYFIANLPGPLRYLVHIGTHVASISSGLSCANDIFAAEMVNLWEDGFLHNGRHYVVAMLIHNTDGKGWEELWQAQGSGSLRGSTKFNEATGTYVSTGRVCYEIGRRMLPMNHPLRTDSHTNEKDRRHPLTLRSYADVTDDANNGTPASPCNGIKGKHPFHSLPYMKYTLRAYDLMHVIGNIVKQSLKLLRRNTTEKPNRSVSQGVLEFEQARGRFGDLRIKGSMPWTLTKEEEKLVDQRLESVVCVERSQVPKKLMLHLGFKKTHELLIFAFNYAQHCLGDLGSREHTTIILRLFKLLRTVSADSLKLTDAGIEALILEFAIISSTMSNLFPIGEQTFAFNQLLPIIMELRRGGPPRRYWMFRFEAIHKLLKSYMKNVSLPISSIVKNLSLSERCRNIMSHKLSNQSAVAKFFESVGGCSHFGGNASLTAKSNQLYVEEEVNGPPIIHTVKQSRFIDIHGFLDSHVMGLVPRQGMSETEDLFQAVYSQATTGTVLQKVYEEYQVKRQQCRGRAGRGRGRGRGGRGTITTFAKWVTDVSNNTDRSREYPSLKNFFPGVNPVDDQDNYYDNLSQDQQDWVDLTEGLPKNLLIKRNCTLCGLSVEASWKIESTGFMSFKFWSLDQISQLNVRRKAPTILSWWVQDSRNCTVQVFGVPIFFFRLSYTISCVDQAFAAMSIFPLGTDVTAANEAVDGQTIVRKFDQEEFKRVGSLKKVDRHNYFVRLSDIIHCRYGVAFDPQRVDGGSERVTFTSLDYESYPSRGSFGFGYDIGDGLLGNIFNVIKTMNL
jgi:hypothetical protein